MGGAASQPTSDLENQNPVSKPPKPKPSDDEALRQAVSNSSELSAPSKSSSAHSQRSQKQLQHVQDSSLVSNSEPDSRQTKKPVPLFPSEAKGLHEQSDSTAFELVSDGNALQAVGEYDRALKLYGHAMVLFQYLTLFLKQKKGNLPFLVWRETSKCLHCPLQSSAL